jgi:hypothetical protein
VQYVSLLKIIIIGLNNCRRIALPIEEVPALSKATQKVLQNYELLGRGTAINFPDIDVALPIDGIIKGVYGKSRWMAELGQKDASAKTDGLTDLAGEREEGWKAEESCGQRLIATTGRGRGRLG